MEGPAPGSLEKRINSLPPKKQTTPKRDKSPSRFLFAFGGFDKDKSLKRHEEQNVSIATCKKIVISQGK
jgi:hypothetical protein